MSKKQNQIKELKEGLASPEEEVKVETLRKIIEVMTRGKDVSSLFMEVLKNIETTTPNIKIKKLVYIYVINYAKSFPAQAIMAINTFRKDAGDKKNPLVRALSVRTMGCIKIKQMAVYLSDTLKASLVDEDSYVRKTAALCVAKMYDIDPVFVEEQGLLKQLESLLRDGNATVVANALASLMLINDSKGETTLPITSETASKLLIAINDCPEWSVIYILQALAQYIPKNNKQADEIMDRVVPKLSHANCGVVFSAVKIIIRYMEFLTSAESIRSYCAKLTLPLTSMVDRVDNPEIAYVALKNINLVLQKRPNIVPKDISPFFVKYDDPLYIKLQKVNILGRIATQQNILSILHEFKDYCQEVDVEFVKSVVTTIGRCAIKLEKMADKCVTALCDCLTSKNIEVKQQCIVVVRDVFRKYPGRYKSIIPQFCENIKAFEDNEAKAAIIWIIGQYVDYIQNAGQILQSFAQNFKDQGEQVQNQILTSAVKFMIRKPEEGEQLVKGLIKLITTTSENPDLRDRAYIYWRLLGTNPQLAASVVFYEKPNLSQQTYQIEGGLLDKLIQNLGTLASVYYKPPVAFIKKLRDLINAKVWQDLDGEELLSASPSGGQVDFFGDDSGKQSEEGPVFSKQKLTTEVQPKQSAGEIDLLGDQPVVVAKPAPRPAEPAPRKAQPAKQQHSDIFDDILGGNPKPKIQTQQKIASSVIAETQLLSGSTPSFGQKARGLVIRGRIIPKGAGARLCLSLKNGTGVNLSGFMAKVNSNSFSLGISGISLQELAHGSSASVEMELNTAGSSDGQPPKFPFCLEVAIKTNVDVFVFKVTCPLLNLLSPDGLLSAQAFQQFSDRPNVAKAQEVLQLKGSFQDFDRSLKEYRFFQVCQKVNGGAVLHSYSGRLVNEMPVLLNVIDKGETSCPLQMIAFHPTIIPLLKESVWMLAQ